MSIAAPTTKETSNTIHLGVLWPPLVDWKAANDVLRMFPGTAAVEMEPAFKETSGIFLPETVAGRLRPDTGTVLARGPDVNFIEPGDRVCVLPYDGKHFTSFEHAGYKSSGRVRLLGISTMNPHERSRTPIEEIIVAKIQEFWGDCDMPYGQRGAQVMTSAEAMTQTPPAPVKRVVPIKRWTLIRRFAEHGTDRGIELPDSAKYREHKATVMVCGDECYKAKAGDTVVYQAHALVLDFEFGEKYGFEGDPKDYCLIHEDDLHCRLLGE